MLNDMAWRKIPRDLMTNPRIRSIAMRIDPRLRQAVFAFYPACLMQATDDGILDISDTEVFADLLLLDDEEDVVELTRLFIKRGFFESLNEDDTLLYILDWDNPNEAHVYNNKRVSETADERRARVLGAMKNPKNKRKKPQVQAQESEAPEEEETLDASKAQQGSFFVPENSRENILRDKNGKSVATNREIREIREIRDEIQREEIKDREIERHTHTESTNASVSAIAREALLSGEGETEGQTYPDAGQEDIQEGQPEENPGQNDRNTGHTTQEESAEKIKAQDSETVQALSPAQWTPADTKKYSQEMNIPDKPADYMKALKTYDSWRTCGVFWAFFVRNNSVGLQTEKQLDYLEDLVIKCEMIKELKNPSYVIAGALCSAFQDLVSGTGSFKGWSYHKGMLATPENFLKPSVFPRIYAEAKRRLSPGKTAGEKWSAIMAKYAAEAEKDAKTYNRSEAFTAECKAWGIDPTSPGAYTQYCAKLSQRIRGSTG